MPLAQRSRRTAPRSWRNAACAATRLKPPSSCRAGRAADLFYVTQGSVAWILADDQGHALALAYLNAGEFFGEIGLFGEGASRSAQVRARSNCEVAQIRASKLLELSDLQPSILAAMTGQLARCLLAPTVVWAV